jgi:hypothetical protein
MATEARETAGLIGSDKVEGTPVYDAKGFCRKFRF